MAAAGDSLRASFAQLKRLVAERDVLHSELLERIEVLEGEVGERDARIGVLEDEVGEREERIVELEAVICELRARLAENSHNSSRPPSSDGLAKEPVEKSNKKRSLRRRSGLKPGGQSGHVGHHVKPRETPDDEKVHPLERCEECGTDLSGQPIVQSRSRQVLDLPEMPRLWCVQHWIQTRLCPCCGKLRSSRFPAEASAPVCYGPRIKALGIYLVSYQHLPCERASELLSDWLGAPVSVGSLQAWVAAGAAGLEGFLEEIRARLECAEVAHFDETGGRIDGCLQYIHAASTEQLTLYTAHPKRGVKAMTDAGVLPGFRGIAVHDGYASYRTFTDALHALCNAHHLRELLSAEEQGQLWAVAMSGLLVDAKLLVDQAKASGLTQLNERQLKELHASYREVITMGYDANPGLEPHTTGRRPKRIKAQNLLLRLDEREHEALRFAHDFRVPFDNNLCERDLRMVKLQQKISGCWRTSEGAKRFLAIRSYISTARKQGLRPAEALTRLTADQPWLPMAASP
ncbi:MAG: IS66 family transposase [Solirubrobacteraceae bacterium]